MFCLLFPLFFFYFLITKQPRCTKHPSGSFLLHITHTHIYIYTLSTTTFSFTVAKGELGPDV